MLVGLVFSTAITFNLQNSQNLQKSSPRFFVAGYFNHVIKASKHNLVEDDDRDDRDDLEGHEGFYKSTFEAFVDRLEIIPFIINKVSEQVLASPSARAPPFN